MNQKSRQEQSKNNRSSNNVNNRERSSNNANNRERSSRNSQRNNNSNWNNESCNNEQNARNIADQWLEPEDEEIESDVLGSYTGLERDGSSPVQDSDDL